MRIPADASPAVQQAFRELAARLDRLETENQDLKGRRLMNLGQPEAQTDAARLMDVQAADTTLPTDPTFQSVTAQKFVRVLGDLILQSMADTGLLYVDSVGRVQNDATNLSWHYTNLSLILGATVVVKWHHLAELRSPATGVLELSGEDHNVTNQFARLALGLDDASHPALVVNGTGLDLRVGGGGGALTALTVGQLTAGGAIGGASVSATGAVSGATVSATGSVSGGSASFTGNCAAGSYTAGGSNGVDFGPSAITSITIKKGIVIAAS